MSALNNSAGFNTTLGELFEVVRKSAELAEVVASTTDAIVNCLRSGGKVLSCGNGGSSADALHLVEELVGRYKRDRRSLPGICLSADVSILTCIANDYGYDNVFSRQIEGLGRPDDLLVGFTTSGNSPNILKAFETASRLGLKTIFLGGKDGGQAKGICDWEIIVPSATTARIQEIHTVVLHHWLEAIDNLEW